MAVSSILSRVCVCFVVLLGLSFSAGCTHTTTIQSWQPAEIDVEGMNKVTILNFQGENGNGVASALTAKLWENNFFTLVDRSQLPPVMHASGGSGGAININQAVEVGRQLDIDGIILGDVLSYTCDDHVSQNSNFSLASFKAKDGKKKQSASDLGIGYESNETLTRQATVTLAFRLLDVRTGQVRASRQVTKSYHGQVINGEGNVGPKDEILASLLDGCLQEITAMLAPHLVPVDVELIAGSKFRKGGGLINEGLKHAKANNWREAEAAWQAALTEDPESHAALYNLAIAHEAQHQYPQAQSLIMQAVSHEPDPKYVTASSRIKASKSSYLLVQQQKDTRLAQQQHAEEVQPRDAQPDQWNNIPIHSITPIHTATQENEVASPYANQFK